MKWWIQVQSTAAHHRRQTHRRTDTQTQRRVSHFSHHTPTAAAAAAPSKQSPEERNDCQNGRSYAPMQSLPVADSPRRHRGGPWHLTSLPMCCVTVLGTLLTLRSNHHYRRTRRTNTSSASTSRSAKHYLSHSAGAAAARCPAFPPALQRTLADQAPPSAPWRRRTRWQTAPHCAKLRRSRRAVPAAQSPPGLPGAPWNCDAPDAWQVCHLSPFPVSLPPPAPPAACILLRVQFLLLCSFICHFCCNCCTCCCCCCCFGHPKPLSLSRLSRLRLQ